MATPWRVAYSLGNNSSEGLLGEINKHAPNRSKSSDGGVGDAAHASRNSDHNPFIIYKKMGIVRARDFTHDPMRGFNSYQFARSVVKSRDKRIKYVISNGEIWTPARGWYTYTGSNPHDHHAHVSVSETPALFDDKSDWVWEAGMVDLPGDRPVLPQITEPVLRKGSPRKEDVRRLQALLGVTVDGDFGPATERAVKAFQAARNLTADGVVGLYTWRALKAAPKLVPVKEDSPKVIIPASTFDRVIEFVLDDEGDELNLSPNEPGGASRYGVSIDALSKFLGRKATVTDLRALTPASAAQVYRAQYWNAIGADKLAPGLNYAAFDMAVNSGVATVDGRGMDDYLNRALAASHTLTGQIDALCDFRLERMRNHVDWNKYKGGWSARVARVRSRAHTLSGVAPAVKIAA